MRNLEEEQYPETFEFNTDGQNFPMEGLKFVGIMALLDPPRESVP
jgi:sodium/potassium-transporting ATPase subunit alpha